MKKLARYGFLLLVLLVGLTVLVFNNQAVYATDESELELTSTDLAKEVAVEAADRAISRVPRYIRYLDPVIEESIYEARRLANEAMINYGAVRSDFHDLDRLEAAEKMQEKRYAIDAARAAIDKIPPLHQITEQHRAIIEEARRLTDIAIAQYGATWLDICWRYQALVDAEERVEDPYPDPEPDPVVDPDPEPDPVVDPDIDPDLEPLPPTGAITTTILSGLALTGAGLWFLGKRKRRL